MKDTPWQPVSQRLEKIIKGLEQAQKAIDMLIEQELEKVENMKKTVEVLKERGDGQGKK